MSFSEYLHLQIQEALSAENRWFASEKAGYEIRDPNQLFKYYVQVGASERFAQKYRPLLDASCNR